jgi:hypothetical protein
MAISDTKSFVRIQWQCKVHLCFTYEFFAKAGRRRSIQLLNDAEQQNKAEKQEPPFPAFVLPFCVYTILNPC